MSFQPKILTEMRCEYNGLPKKWFEILLMHLNVQVSLEKYKGHVCIIVNVASKWGKTDVNYK